MIRALDRTLEQLLRSELAEIDASQLEISFAQPSGDWVSRRSGQLTLNLFLYDIRENATLRRHQWQQIQEGVNGSGRAGAVSMKRTPLMLDCFYLVSAWSGADEARRPLDEHELLSLAIRALARYPVLNPTFEERQRAEALVGARFEDSDARQTIAVERTTAGRKSSHRTLERRAWLNDSGRNPLRDVAVEVRTRLAYHDVLTNPAEVWSALEAQMKVGVSFVVTLPMDPWEEVEAFQVLQKDMHYTQSNAPGGGGAYPPLYAIGGVIYDQARVPQAGLDLRLLHGEWRDPIDVRAFGGEDEHRFAERTNAGGAYRFAGLPSGAYTLAIRVPQTGEIVTRNLTISPAGPTGYDFTI